VILGQCFEHLLDRVQRLLLRRAAADRQGLHEDAHRLAARQVALGLAAVWALHALGHAPEAADRRADVVAGAAPVLVEHRARSDAVALDHRYTREAGLDPRALAVGHRDRAARVEADAL